MTKIIFKRYTAMKRLFKLAMIVALVAAVAVGFAACDKKEGLRFAAPDGTPALAMLRLASQKQKLGGYDVGYEVVSSDNIAVEMTSGKADIVIMPVNAGAMQIAKNGVDYKLVSIAVEGSLYLIGNKVVGGNITFDDIKGKRIGCIGETGVPGLIFRYVMAHNNIDIVTDSNKTLDENDIFVSYEKNGGMAAEKYASGDYDYIVVGEPAATAQKMKQGSNINAEMDMQVEYGRIAGVDNYPQAGLFVKTSLFNDAKLMDALFEALDDNEDWIENNRDKVTETAKNIGSATTFPPSAIDRCALDLGRLDQEDKAEIIAFLQNVAGTIDWAANSAKIFG